MSSDRRCDSAQCDNGIFVPSTKGSDVNSNLIIAVCHIQGGMFPSPRALVCYENFIDWCCKHCNTK
jgi:hypothetical protein